MKVYAKFGIPILIVLIGFLIMVTLLSLKKDLPKKEPELSTKVVDTELVEKSEISAVTITYGRVASTQPIELYSEAAGILMEGDVPFQPAQSFSKGDLILRIDDRQTKLSLNSAKSDLLTALASVLPEIKLDFPDEYQIWQDYFNGCDFDKKLMPLPKTDNPKIKMYLSRFNVYKLYFTASDLEIQLDKHYIYAPFDGSITEASLRLGATARVGSLLGRIINLEELEVDAPSVDEQLWRFYGDFVFDAKELLEGIIELDEDVVGAVKKQALGVEEKIRLFKKLSTGTRKVEELLDRKDTEAQAVVRGKQGSYRCGGQ